MCHRQCMGNKMNCLEHYYHLEKSTTTYTNIEYSQHGQYNFQNFFIHFPTEPTVVYEISLKMSFEEYLSLTASIISLWFGVSIITGTRTLRHILCKLKIKAIFNKLIIFVKNKYHQTNIINISVRYKVNVKQFLRFNNNNVSSLY